MIKHADCAPGAYNWGGAPMMLERLATGLGILLLAATPALAQHGSAATPLHNPASHAQAPIPTAHAGGPRGDPARGSIPQAVPHSPIYTQPQSGAIGGHPFGGAARNPQLARPNVFPPSAPAPNLPPIPLRMVPFQPLPFGPLPPNLPPGPLGLRLAAPVRSLGVSGRFRSRYDFPFDTYYPFYYQSLGTPMCGPYFQVTPDWPSASLGGATCASGSFFSLGYMPPYSTSFPPAVVGQPLFGANEPPAVSPSGYDTGTLDRIAGVMERGSSASNPQVKVTTLVLKQGIFVDVIDYWTENGKLGYITPYGIQFMTDLNDLDQDKTQKLNSDRGVQFELHERPTGQPPAPQP